MKIDEIMQISRSSTVQKPRALLEGGPLRRNPENTRKTRVIQVESYKIPKIPIILTPQNPKESLRILCNPQEPLKVPRNPQESPQNP